MSELEKLRAFLDDVAAAKTHPALLCRWPPGRPAAGYGRGPWMVFIVITVVDACTCSSRRSRRGSPLATQRGYWPNRPVMRRRGLTMTVQLHRAMLKASGPRNRQSERRLRASVRKIWNVSSSGWALAST